VPVVRLAALALFCTVFLASCFPGGKQPYAVQLYTLEYAFSAPTDTRLDEVVRIDRFFATQSYNTSAMFYRPEPYKMVAYNYHRWRMSPADMVAERLLRDFGSSGLFRAVFSYKEKEDSRFVVDGGVEEFLQSREDGDWCVILSVQVNLLDRDRSNTRERLLFQKRYRSVEPVVKESPAEFARGMSRAMSKVSEEILKDVYIAVLVTTGNKQPLR
jgi:ABC-type uncharacterized transport system auxiliary subunit